MTFLDRPEGRLAVALGIGLVIGAERERRKGEGPDRKGAGIRTFSIVAMIGGVVAQLDSQAMLVAAALVIGAITVAQYALGDRADPGFTTEVAIVLTYCLGALADTRPHVALAGGLTAATLLAFRTTLHSAVRSVLSDEELRDALLFAVAAVVVLPLVPDETVDPYDVLNPFTLWRLVVLLMGVSGAGYIAQRVIGPRYGLALAGFGSGFVSSSATIASMGHRAREHANLLRPAVAGAAASTVSTFVLMAILIGAADPALLAQMAAPLGAAGGTALAYALFMIWRAHRAEADAPPGRAFRLSTAILFACLVTGIAFVSSAARAWIGTSGVVAAAGVAGLADTHAAAAASAAMAAAHQIDRDTAELAVLLALSTNSVTKMVLAATSGPRSFSVRVIVGVALVIGAAWAVALVGLR